MASKLEGLPPDLVGADLDERSIYVTVDETLYPVDAVYGAAYVFLDRCYVLLDKPQPGQVRVTLSAKSAQADAEALRALVGEFSNELLSCAWRHQITQENRALIEAVTLQAIGGAMGPPSLDDLAAFDFTEEPFEDPLGIAMSWEEKYKKKDKAEEKAEAAKADAAKSDAAKTEAKSA